MLVEVVTSGPPRLPVKSGIPEDVEAVLATGEARCLDRIEPEIVFDLERSNETCRRKVYNHADVSFASKTYTRGKEKAHVTCSMLQQAHEQSAGRGRPGPPRVIAVTRKKTHGTS